jgi:hypothetical protein
MKHKFTSRELLLIIIAAFLALGIFYYELVYKSVVNSVNTYDVTSLQDQLIIEQAKASSEKQMKDAIEAEKANPSTGEVEVYNNLANEVNELGRILNGSAEEVSISWASPTLTDTTVRRIATISFKAESYDTARSLIKSINDMKYKNSISKISLAHSTSSTDTSTVTLSMTLTFFETTTGATSLEGLITTDSTTTK